jgi:hypothetical protein
MPLRPPIHRRHQILPRYSRRSHNPRSFTATHLL